MENKKSIRNPFPKIAKVFKYEMKHSVRILLPVYYNAWENDNNTEAE